MLGALLGSAKDFLLIRQTSFASTLFDRSLMLTTSFSRWYWIVTRRAQAVSGMRERQHKEVLKPVQKGSVAA